MSYEAFVRSVFMKTGATGGSSFTEQGVVATGTEYLTSTGAIGPDSANSLLFASFIPTAGARRGIIGVNGDTLRTYHNGNHTVSYKTDLGGNLNALSPSSSTAGDRVHILISTRVDGGTGILTVTVGQWDETNGWQTDEGFNVNDTNTGWTSQADTTFRLLGRTDGTNNTFEGTMFRAALWIDLASPVDITSSTVRDNFFSGASLVDPATSQSAYGTTKLAFDCYGDASTWNAGSFTYSPSWTVSGTFTDA